MNKKGVGEGHLGQIIFIVICITLLVILALSYILPWLFGASDDQLCQQSVAARAATIKKFAGMQFDLGLLKDLNCKTKFLIVKDGGVYDDEDKICVAFDQKNKDTAIKKIIADEMVRCWNMMGKGELEIWGGTESKVHCINCTEISFEMENPPEQIANFDQFLQNTPVSDKNRETYAQFFKFDANELTDYDINPGVPLDIVYIQTDHAGKLGEFFGDAKSGCKKGSKIVGLINIGPIPNPVNIFGGFVGGCVIGSIAAPIASHFNGDENVQPMLLVLPATEFSSAKCEATY